MHTREIVLKLNCRTEVMVNNRWRSYVKKLTDAETRYYSNELECLVVVFALNNLRAYLYGRQFYVQTIS